MSTILTYQKSALVKIIILITFPADDIFVEVTQVCGQSNDLVVLGGSAQTVVFCNQREDKAIIPRELHIMAILNIIF